MHPPTPPTPGPQKGSKQAKKGSTLAKNHQNNANIINQPKYYNDQFFFDFNGNKFVPGVAKVQGTKTDYIGIGYSVNQTGKGVWDAGYKNGKCHATCQVPYYISEGRIEYLRYPCTWKKYYVLPYLMHTPVINIDIVPKTNEDCKLVKEDCHAGCKWVSDKCVPDKDFVPNNVQIF